MRHCEVVILNQSCDLGATYLPSPYTGLYGVRLVVLADHLTPGHHHQAQSLPFYEQHKNVIQ